MKEIDPCIRYISWDLDGTLYDLTVMKRFFRELVWERLLSASCFTALGELGRLRRHYAAMSKARESGGDLSAIDVCWEPESFQPVVKRWLGEALEKTGPRPGVAACLEHWSKSAYRQILVSDFDWTGKLEALSLPTVFDAKFAGEQLGYIKPSPELFRRVCFELDTSTDALLHIGDVDERDGEAARLAGCQVWILGKDFEDFAELIPTLPRP